MRQHDLYISVYDRRPRGRSIFFYWVVLLVLYLAAALAAYALTPGHSSVISQFVRTGSFLGPFQFILGLRSVELMLAIWVKNLMVAFVLLVLGGYLGGLVSYLVVGVNGLLLGAVIRILYAGGASGRFVAAGLLPHGVIEMSTIFFAGALAIWATKRQMRLSRRLGAGLRWVVPLLLVAAAVETYVTPHVMALFR